MTSLFPYFYWENREGMEAMAPTSSASDLFFTWQSFCSRQSEEWAPFSPVSIPCTYVQKRDPLPFSPLRKLRTRQRPDRAGWEEAVKRALQAIAQGDLDKVVLARQEEIECEGPIDPLSLFFALRQDGQTNFFLQMAPHIAFLGSTPERLYKRVGRLIECDALAGTRPLSRKEELLKSEKDLHEFAIVKNRIGEVLRPFCRSKIETSSTSIACTATLGHLYAKISGTLSEEVDDRTLLSLLHPTPALGGWPKEGAAAWLRDHEPFVRGLYGAPIGYTSEERGEFAVAIRSCLVIGSRIYLYAGTGIVAGSDPALEWEESEQKLLRWRSFIHG